MITAQDIREKTFEKARFNGYDMNDVDDFLEELADEITNAQKENAVLKTKMKVLVDKIEEYRANEEALNMAVVSAQKLAVQIEADARTRANNMLAEAERQVKAKVGSIADQTAEQERRLADATASAAKFYDSVRKMCNLQIKKIDDISSGIVPQPKPAAPNAQPSVEDAVRSIESSVAKAQAEPAFSIDLSAEGPAAAPSMEATQTFTF